ncbi:MAG: hypothetical protein H6Q72_3672 [Firmicutes bacterium]|nr:hypothetical protein [Bacillota bacterium]
MYTIKEFAKEKGMSEVVLRAWIARHGLSVRKIGRRIYIVEEDYLKWLETKKSSSSERNEEHSYVGSRIPAFATKMKKIY